MAHINIFVAGSKKLQTYRNELVLWANAKNYDYRRQGIDLQINTYSFKEVGDDQDTYNKVIAEDSDIVLFLIEGSIGEKTKEELVKAKEALHRKNRPEIWVFTHDADVNAIAYLEGALARRFSIDFDSSDGLIKEVNSRMDNYVNKKFKNLLKRRKVSTKTQSSKRGIFVGLLVCVLGIVLGWCIARCSGAKHAPVSDQPTMHATVEKPMLMIAGGGSVANFIEKETSIDCLANYSDGYYIHLPTKSAWELLIEEVVSLQDTRRYYPVCISASEAADSVFTSSHITAKNFRDKAIIVSCKLGVDPLVCYVQNGKNVLERHNITDFSRPLSKSKLWKLITDPELNVYATSPNSGTRDEYCKFFGVSDSTLSRYLAGQYSQHSQVGDVNKGKPYVLLGSRYYQVSDNNVQNNVVALQTDSVKPMMVYFMAYKKLGEKVGEQHEYYIPQETIDFLQKIEAFSTLKNCVSTDGRVRLSDTRDHKVIYDENSLARPGESFLH